MNIGQLWATLGIDSTALEHSIVALRKWEAKASASMLKVQRRLDTISTRFGAMRRGMMTGMVLPMALVGTAAFKMYKDFEFNMNKVVSLVGVARKQVDAWSKEILAMAPRVGKGPVELAKAMYFITSAGIRGSEALDILEESAKSAASGLGEVKVVADLLTSAMNAYGKENLTAARANDILTATVREGKAEADLLAQSLGLVLPIASAMGASFDQVGAATAAMTRTGTKAATAAIQLRQMFNSILKPAKEAEAAMIHMGISSDQLRRIIKEKGLMTALVKLDAVTKEYGINAVGKVIPNIRSLTGFLDIMGKNFAANEILTRKIRDSLGDANRMFEETAHTVEFRFNAAIARGQSSMVKFGEAVTAGVLPIIERLSMRLEKMVDRFDALSETEKTARIQTGLWVGKIFIAVFAVEKLTRMASNLIFVFRGLLKWIASVQWPAFAAVIGKIGVAFKAVELAAIGVASAFAAVLGVGLVLGRRVEKDLKKEYELRKAGITLMGDQLEAYKKLNAVQRELELRRLTEIEHQKELNAQYGVYIGLLDSVGGLTMETLGLPGMNITQLEDLRDKATGTMGDIQRYIEELSETAEIEIPVGLQAMDPQTIVSYFMNQAKLIESTLIENATGQELYNAYQGTFKDIGGVMEEEMGKSSANMSNAFNVNAMAMGVTMGVVSDTIYNALNKGKWLEDPSEAFFNDRAESAKDASELMVVIAKTGADKEKEILEKKMRDILSIISVANTEMQRQAEENRKKLKSLAEAEVGIQLSAQMKAIATMGALVWTELEVAEAKVGAFEKALNSLAELGIGPADEDMQKWTKSLIAAQKEVTRLDVDVTNLKEAMVDLQKQLAISEYKGGAFLDFDADQASLKAYESFLNKLIERKVELQSVAGPGESIAADVSYLIWDTNAPKAYKTEIMQVEEQIAAVTAAMEELRLSAGKISSDKAFYDLQQELYSIESALKTGLINPMDAAKQQLSAFTKVYKAAISGEILGDPDQMRWFFENIVTGAENARIALDKFAFQQTYLSKILQSAFQGMQNVISDALSETENILQAFGKFFGDFMKGVIIKLVAATAAALALAVVLTFIVPGKTAVNLFTGLNEGFKFMDAFKVGLKSITGFQHGGVVPPGYPNDSFPALLTSGEKIIPAHQPIGSDAGFGEVRFEIEGDVLMGILRKRLSVEGNL